MRVCKWYEHVPASVCRNVTGDVEIWWDRTAETGENLAHNRPDVAVINRRERKRTLVDFSVPLNKNVLSKENEKLLNYAPLAQLVWGYYTGSSRRLFQLCWDVWGRCQRG